MTIEEAINKLQLKLNLANELVDQDMDYASAIKIEAAEKAFILSRIKWGQENAEVFRMAIKALEKQIPKKPSMEFNYEDDDYFCPDCGFTVIEEYDDFCGNCGQKIDWSKE